MTPESNRGSAGIGRLLVRIIGGTAFSYALTNIVMIAWLIAAAIAYGDLERALDLMAKERWAEIAFASFFTSASAAFCGGCVAAVAGGIGQRPHTPIILGTVKGAALATLTGTVIGLSIGWTFNRVMPHTPAMLWVALATGIVVGALSGLLAIRLPVGHWKPATANSDTDSALAPDDIAPGPDPDRIP